MITASALIEEYNESINEDGFITVYGLEFLPSDILKKMDPIAYRVGFFDWLDSIGLDSDNIKWNISL